MFNAEQFVREMARKSNIAELTRALERLWPLNYDVIRIIQPLNDPIVIIPENIMEIKSVFIDQIPLSRTREILLDSENPSWKTAVPDTPKQYIWNGEDNNLRLHPAPDIDSEVWIIVQRTPVNNLPKWFNLIAAINAVEILTLGDQVAGRGAMAKYMETLSGAFNESIKQKL